MSGIWRSVSEVGYDASVAENGNAFAYSDSLYSNDGSEPLRQQHLQRIQREQKDKELQATRDDKDSALHAFAFEVLSEMAQQEFARLKREFDEAYEQYNDLYQQRRAQTLDLLSDKYEDIEQARKEFSELQERALRLADGRKVYRSEANGLFYDEQGNELAEELQQQAEEIYLNKPDTDFPSYEDRIAHEEKISELLKDTRELEDYLEDLETNKAEIDAVKEEMDDLNRRFEAGELSQDEYLEERDKIRQRIDLVEEETQRLEDNPPAGYDLDADMDNVAYGQSEMDAFAAYEGESGTSSLFAAESPGIETDVDLFSAFTDSAQGDSADSNDVGLADTPDNDNLSQDNHGGTNGPVTSPVTPA